jgi:hypothetical protein
MNQHSLLIWLVLGCVCSCAGERNVPPQTQISGDAKPQELAAAPKTVHGPGAATSAHSAPTRSIWRNPLTQFELDNQDPREPLPEWNFVTQCPNQDGPTLVWCRVPKDVAILHPGRLPGIADAGMCRKGQCITNLQCMEECAVALVPEAKRRVEQAESGCAGLDKTERDSCMSKLGAPDSPETIWAEESLLQCLSVCGFIAEKYRDILWPKEPKSQGSAAGGGLSNGH